MNIKNVNATTNNNLYLNKTTNNAKPDEKDTTSDSAVVYEKNKDTHEVDIKKVNELLDESKKATQRMADLFEKLIFNQVKTNSIANGTTLLTELDDIFEKINNKEDVVVEISDEIREAAKADVAEDGYYSVESTSTRIVDFAKALANGNPDKLELLKTAIDDGFEKAKELWGDDLPQISLDTYDAVMEGFSILEQSLLNK